MKYSQGDILIDWNGNKRKILAVVGEVYVLSFMNDFLTAVDGLRTQYELDRDGYELHIPDWKPEAGEEYWFVSDKGEIFETTFNKHETLRLKIGNCYRTEEEAEAARERVLKAYKDE